MSSFTLTVEHADGGSSVLNIPTPDALGDANAPSLRSVRITRKLIREPEAADEAEVSVYRDAWREIEDNLDRVNDKLLIEEGGSPIFGGRLRDYEYQETTVSVIIDGPKRDAIDAASSDPSVIYNSKPDVDILSTILGRVGTVSAGVTETVDSVAFSESHASPGKSITKLAATADAEVQYRATGSGYVVDYVDRLGNDRSGETLSPSNSNVYGEIRIREKIRQNINKITVLGANSGRGQTSASATTSSFDPSVDRVVERKHVDKDVLKDERAASLAETLVEEYDGSREYLEVECQLPISLDPSVGDSFSVDLPAYGRSKTLRITMLDRIIDAAGDVYRAVLSNRRHTRSTDGQRRADSVRSIGEADAGQIVRDSQSEGYTKLDSGEPQEWFFDFPSGVINELEATLRVESRPFRRPSAATGHSHSFSVPDHKHGVTIEDSTTSGVIQPDGVNTTYTDNLSTEDLTDPQNFQNIQTVTINPNTEQIFIQFSAEVSASNGANRVSLRVKNDTTGETYQAHSHNLVKNDVTYISSYHHVFDDVSDNQITFEGRPRRRGSVIIGDEKVTLDYNISIHEVPKHDHDVSLSYTTTTSNGGATSDTTASETALEPGIVTTNNEVSNVSVDIGGTTVVSGLDAPIEETVDITDELSSGANKITATSDSLGELRTSITYEALKNASR